MSEQNGSDQGPTIDEYVAELPAAEANQFLVGRAIDFCLEGKLSKALSCLGRAMSATRRETLEQATLAGIDPAPVVAQFEAKLAGLKHLMEQTAEQEKAVRAQMAGADAGAGDEVSEGGVIVPGPGTTIKP